jgi:lysophospholipase L1-like esterase
MNSTQAESARPSTSRDRRVWPLLVWVWPLPPIVVVLAIFFLKVAGRYGPLTPLGWVLLSVALVSAGVIVAPLLSRRGRAWIDDRRLQLLLLNVVGLSAIVTCDIVLTLSGIAPTLAKQRERSLLYLNSCSTRHRLAPSRVVPREGQPDIVVNRRGYRGPEIVAPKPAGVQRVVVLGGSQVFGFQAGNWPGEAGEILRSCGHKVEVINASVPGHSSADSLGKLFADIWTMEPDVIVVCHGWNDLKYLPALTQSNSYLQYMGSLASGNDWRLEPTGLDRLMCASAIYRLARGDLAHMIVDREAQLRTPMPKDENSDELIAQLARAPSSGDPTLPGVIGLRQLQLNLRLLCDAGRNVGATVVLCKQARLPAAESSPADREKIRYRMLQLEHDAMVRAFSLVDQVVEQVAAEKGVSVFDMSSRFTGRSELFHDHVHFTVAGSEAAASLLADQLESLLGSAQHFGRPVSQWRR